MSLIEMSFILLCALVSAAAGLAYVSRDRRVQPAHPKADPLSLHFLFRDLDLEHASRGAEPFLCNRGTQTDWAALRNNLSTRFPGLPDDDRLLAVNSLTLKAVGENDHAVVRLDREDDMTRVTIEDAAHPDIKATHNIKSMETELATLRLAALGAPYPIWLQGADGALIWRNSAYDDLQSNTTVDTINPTQPVFSLDKHPVQAGSAVRISILNRRTDQMEWYSVTAAKTTESTVFHAVNINAVIQAEVAQRNFVQTLAKTFAQLSIGLAIFDRNGQLALFNPALVDLTSLPAEFLSARPDLLSFFDRLRDNRVMPEPKNYLSWRQEISNVIAAATHGSYQETWTLDTGHTYRVVGRPHPDGAVAFLIEDITAEVSLTRNFRAELELGQSLMDTFEDALVVFSSVGILTFCNAAYCKMWKLDPENSFADVTIVDSIKAWQAQCRPDPAWGDMRDYVMKIGDRAPWDAQIHHQTKGAFLAQVSPIVSGATVIRFSETVDSRTPERTT
jgi:PAS domain-containing protein